MIYEWWINDCVDVGAAITDEAQVRVSYAGSTVTDASNAENALVALDDSVVINGTADSTAPTLTSATVVDGSAVKLNFSERCRRRIR